MSFFGVYIRFILHGSSHSNMKRHGDKRQRLGCSSDDAIVIDDDVCTSNAELRGLFKVQVPLTVPVPGNVPAVPAKVLKNEVGCGNGCKIANKGPARLIHFYPNMDSLRGFVAPPNIGQAFVVDNTHVASGNFGPVWRHLKTGEMCKYEHWYPRVKIYISLGLIPDLKEKLPDGYKSLKEALSVENLKLVPFSKMNKHLRGRVTKAYELHFSQQISQAKDDKKLYPDDSCCMLDVWLDPGDLPSFTRAVLD